MTFKHNWDGHRTVSVAQVAAAKDLMKKGFDLDQAARVVGCLNRDLDVGLWNWIGHDLEGAVEPVQPEPMF